MAYRDGGQIVTNGLVLSLDAADKNSYIGSGTVWNDLSENLNSGSLTNNPIFGSANGGNITFNGSTNYVSGSFNFNLSDNYTLCVWAYIISSSAGASPLSILSGSVFRFIQLGGTINPWQFNDIFLSTAATRQVWTHVVGVQSGVNQSLYVNGVLVKTGTTSRTFGGGSYSIGVRSDMVAGTYFSGSVAAAQIYNRALPASEIIQNYNAQKSRFGL